MFPSTKCSVLTGDGVWLRFARWQVLHRDVAPLGSHATSSGPHGSGPSPLMNLIWDHLQIFQGSLILSLCQGQFGLQVIHCFLQLLTMQTGIRWTFTTNKAQHTIPCYIPRCLGWAQASTNQGWYLGHGRVQNSEAPWSKQCHLWRRQQQSKPWEPGAGTASGVWL